MPTAEAVSDYEKERGKPTPSRLHSATQKNLIVALARYEPKYTIFSELTLGLEKEITPDLSVYGSMVVDYTHEEKRMTEAPLTTVEIVSPSQSTQDVVDKVRDMLAVGVKSGWLVQPAVQTVTVYGEDMEPKTFSEGIIRDAVLDDVEVRVEEVFGKAH